jgi:hypothetical protein
MGRLTGCAVPSPVFPAEGVLASARSLRRSRRSSRRRHAPPCHAPPPRMVRQRRGSPRRPPSGASRQTERCPRSRRSEDRTGRLRYRRGASGSRALRSILAFGAAGVRYPRAGPLRHRRPRGQPGGRDDLRATPRRRADAAPTARSSRGRGRSTRPGWAPPLPEMARPMVDAARFGEGRPGLRDPLATDGAPADAEPAPACPPLVEPGAQVDAVPEGGRPSAPPWRSCGPARSGRRHAAGCGAPSLFRSPGRGPRSGPCA